MRSRASPPPPTSQLHFISLVQIIYQQLTLAFSLPTSPLPSRFHGPRIVICPGPAPRELVKWRLLRGVSGNEGNALVDVLLEVAQAGLEQLLLVAVDLADGQDLLDTVGAELDLGGEELDALVLVQGAVDEGGLDDTLLALGGAQDGVGEAGTGLGHGQGGGTSTVLGLDDLVTAELDTVDELGVGGQIGVVALAEERDDGDTGVAAHNGDVLVLGVGALDLAHETASTDNVEGGDTEQALGVVDTTGLEDLGHNGDGGVDGVRNDEEVGLGGSLGGGLGQVANDGSVGVEEVITGHTGLAGNTGGDQDNIATLQSVSQTGRGRVIAGDGALGVDVRDISSDTYSFEAII